MAVIADLSGEEVYGIVEREAFEADAVDGYQVVALLDATARLRRASATV